MCRETADCLERGDHISRTAAAAAAVSDDRTIFRRRKHKRAHLDVTGSAARYNGRFCARLGSAVIPLRAVFEPSPASAAPREWTSLGRRGGGTWFPTRARRGSVRTACGRPATRTECLPGLHPSAPRPARCYLLRRARAGGAACRSSSGRDPARVSSSGSGMTRIGRRLVGVTPAGALRHVTARSVASGQATPGRRR
jgi:hypothetical protein